MARLSLIALLALAFSGVAFGAPPASQEIVVVDDIHTTAGWSYSVCGMWVSAFKMQPTEPNGVMQGTPATLSLSSLSIFLLTLPSPGSS